MTRWRGCERQRGQISSAPRRTKRRIPRPQQGQAWSPPRPSRPRAANCASRALLRPAASHARADAVTSRPRAFSPVSCAPLTWVLAPLLGEEGPFIAPPAGGRTIAPAPGSVKSVHCSAACQTGGRGPRRRDAPIRSATMPSRRIVIDHVTVGVSDLAASRAFYLAALAPLGFVEQAPWSEDAEDVGFGPPGLDDFYVSTRYATAGGAHIAFAADSHEQVDAFHRAALAAGGRDNGAPGPRL